MTQYVSEMVQKSNTYESVGSKISLILHRPFYIYFCVMPRGSSASVFVGFLGLGQERRVSHSIYSICGSFGGQITLLLLCKYPPIF